MNPYAAGATQDADGYYEGYGRYAQDVVIPAFMAAYTKKDPTTVALIKNNNPNISSNPFSGILPKPNWSITYNGLSKIPGLDKIFTNVTIRHGYHSTLSMNSFNTALLFHGSVSMWVILNSCDTTQVNGDLFLTSWFQTLQSRNHLIR